MTSRVREMSFQIWAPSHDSREGGRIIDSTLYSLIYLLSENKMTTLKDDIPVVCTCAICYSPGTVMLWMADSCLHNSAPYFGFLFFLPQYNFAHYSNSAGTVLLVGTFE